MTNKPVSSTLMYNLNRFADGTFTVTAYDANGRKIAQTDQTTNTTWFGYDALGRLTSVTNALLQVTGYGYDAAGNQTSQVDALNRQTTYAYDALNRRVSRTLPGGQSETMVYDLAGNVATNIDFNGLVITNQYDAMNRLTNRSQGPNLLESYQYDAMGRRTNAWVNFQTASYQYDVRNRLSQKTSGSDFSYQYDGNGNLTNLTSHFYYGDGTPTNQYGYDALNRLTKVTAGAVTAVYGYDRAGNLQTVQYGNGLTNLCQYDSLNRLTNLVWATNGVTVASFYYQLGPAGNRTNLVEYIHASSALQRTNQWQYDPTYRLTNENIIAPTAGTLAYGLDSVGNRLTRSSGAGLGSQSLSYDADDRLTTTDTYDNNGNTTASGGVTYSYNYLNQLTQAGSAALLYYDPDGYRAYKNWGDNAYYAVDDRNPTGYGQVLMAERGNTHCQNVYGLALVGTIPDLEDAPTAGYYYLWDGHGSVRGLLDGSGVVTDTYAYDAYGNLIASTGSTTNYFLYCGEEYDFDLDMYYLRARYYQPGTGRFWTMDTFQGRNQDPLSLHKYLYCQANPVNHIDPRGRDLGDVLTAAFIGGVIAAVSTPYIANAHGPNDPTYPAVTAQELVMNFGVGFVTGGAGNYAFGKIGGGLTGFVERSVASKAFNSSTTIGEYLVGVDDNAMIHLSIATKEELAQGVEAGSSWVRKGDVAHLTPQQYRNNVVGNAAAGHTPDATLFAIKSPQGVVFNSVNVQNVADVVEFVNPQPVIPDAFFNVLPGPPISAPITSP